MKAMKKLLLILLVLVLTAGTMPVASATSSLTIASISHEGTVVKAESFTVSSSVTASNVVGTITVTVKLQDNTGGAVTITDAEKTLTFTANETKNIQWSVTAGTAGTYSNPFTVTATASDGGTATPKTSDTPLTIQERPVLEVTFTKEDKTSVSAGDTVRLEFTVTNSAATGAADATGVTATLTRPTGWSLTTGTSPYSLTTIASGGGSKSGYWIVSADSPGSFNTLTLNVTSTLPGGTITKTVAITRTTPTGGLVGGGGVAPTAPAGETSVSTEPTGEVKSTVTAPSADGKASVVIPRGTIAKDAAGNPLTKVTVAQPSALPAGVPSGVNYVAGYAYDFGPPGATFDPAIEISITFDPADFEGKTPVIYTYEEGEGKWVRLDTTVDWANNIATTKVTHFSTFVLFAEEKVEVTPTPTPTMPPTVAPSPTPTPPVVPPVKPPWGLIIGIIVIVIIIGVAAYYFYTKKKAT